jgi:glycosyltransferase involved in cell wall biosynthesis
MEKEPKITILSQYFYPDVASTGQLMTELALGLKERGCDVRVITGQLSYYKKGKLPAGEDYGGVSIKRVWHTRWDKNKKIGRALNSITFFIFSFFAVSFSRNVPLLIVSNPPFLPLVGTLLKAFRGQKYIFLVHDVYPEIAVKLDYLSERGLITRLWKWANKAIYARADFIVVLGEYMEKEVRKKLRDTGKTQVIHNWADKDFIVPIKKEENSFCKKYGLENKLTVLYSGNIGLSHDLETVILAANGLRDNMDIIFVFIGEGGKKAKLVKMAEDFKLENILFLPYQPQENLPESLTCGDIAVVSLKKGIEGLGVPSKLYTYLAAGQAIAGIVGEKSEITDMIKKCNCGFRVNQGDFEGLIKLLKRLYGDQKLLNETKGNARKCFEENFDKEMAVDKYFEIVREINR